MSETKKGRKQSSTKKSRKNKKRSSSLSAELSAASLSSFITTSKTVHLNTDTNEVNPEKRKSSSYVPKLSLDEFSRTEQITSSSSGSLITPNTKERIIATNKKNGPNNVKDYTKSSPSTTSSTTTSSTPSTPPTKPRRRHENNNNNNNTAIDNIGSVSSASSSSSTLVPKSIMGQDSSGGGNKDIYEKYGNGLIRLNVIEFDNVNFCFICNITTSSIQPNPCIEKTGMRLTDNGGVTVYKQIFCCDDCYLKIQAKKTETNKYNVTITTEALNYFQSIKKVTSDTTVSNDTDKK